MKITYTLKNGINYPNLSLPEQTNHFIGKYGMMRLDFLKQHCKGVYTTLVTEGRLNEYLYELDNNVRTQVKMVTEQLAKKRHITEALKAADQLRWVQEMNNCKAAAEELICNGIMFKAIPHRKALRGRIQSSIIKA